MNAVTEEAILQKILGQLRRSLLQYVNDSYPWTSPQARETLTQLRHVIRDEQKGIAALSDYLRRQRIALPYIGAFPHEFTTINYVALEHLLPLLAENDRQLVVGLERDLSSINPTGNAWDLVLHLLEMKRRHLQTLEALAPPQPAVAGST